MYRYYTYKRREINFHCFYYTNSNFCYKYYIADALEFDLRTNKNVEAKIFRYPDQGHAFLNDLDWNIEKRKELGFVDENSDPLKEESGVRFQAWDRISQFFIKNLGGESRTEVEQFMMNF